MKTFPIRLDDEIKTIPWDMMVDAKARVETLGQLVRSVEDMAVDGLTPEEAIAFLTNKPWERMATTAARMRLRELVTDYMRATRTLGDVNPMRLPFDEMHALVRGADLAPSLIPEPRDLADKTLADLERGVALVKAMTRHITGGTHLARQYAELERILSHSVIAVRALKHRRAGV